MAGDVVSTVKPHEFRHRAFSEYGLGENGNRLLDMYQENLLPEGSLEAIVIKKFGRYLAENPQSMDNRYANKFMSRLGMNNTPMKKWIDIINERGSEYFSEPTNSDQYNKNFFTQSFE